MSGHGLPRVPATPKPDCVLVRPNNIHGYREVMVNGKRSTAHRIALEAHLGRPLRPGYVPDHLCRVRHCINVAHLEEVTGSENSRRGKLLTDNDPCPAGHVGAFGQDERGHRFCVLCRRARAREYQRRLTGHNSRPDLWKTELPGKPVEREPALPEWRKRSLVKDFSGWDRAA